MPPPRDASERLHDRLRLGLTFGAGCAGRVPAAKSPDPRVGARSLARLAALYRQRGNKPAEVVETCSSSPSTKVPGCWSSLRRARGIRCAGSSAVLPWSLLQ